MKKSVLALLFISSSLMSVAQKRTYIDLMGDKDATFYEVQAAFNDFWKDRTPGKGEGYKPFKRFEDFAAKRINSETGKFEHAASSVTEYQKYFGGTGLNKSANSVQNQWKPLKFTNTIPSSGGGAGRLNCVVLHPTNPNTIFVGAVGGGIWRSYDGGLTWASNTDQFGSLAVSDIAFNPKNPNIVYAATGDREQPAPFPHYSVGVLKSIDGGITWNTTGLSYTTSQNRMLGRLLVHPDNPDTVLVAGTDGIYKTINGGNSWVLKHSGNIKDMEFKPGDPNTVYASFLSVFKSVNNGESFGAVPGITSPSRIALAVTPANPNYVYAIAGNGASGLQGIYRSNNSGGTFTLRTATPNVLTWDVAGIGTGGQSWYDLAFEASPTNPEEIYTGGVNIWKSIDGGLTMTIVTHSNGFNGLPLVHSDIHQIIYSSTGAILAANDGGLFITSDGGLTWNDFSSGLAIAEIYRLSTAQIDTSLTLSGWQDNGSNLYKPTSATHVYGGDGMDCQIDQSNNNIMYFGIQQGVIGKSTDGGISGSNIVNNNGSGINSQSAWVTPYILDPQNQNIMYVGKGQVYQSLNAGNSWSPFGTWSGGAGIDQLAIYSSPTTKYLYVSNEGGLYVKKGSANYVQINIGLPGLGLITDIEVSQNDSSKVWITYSLFNTTTVFQSSNAGATWTNISAGLPQIPANCIIHEKNTANLYVGTDIGVFYKDSTSASWAPYGTGLPNVIVTDLDIQYAVGKLRISTFGRGLWETKLFQAPTASPVATFNANVQTACQNTQPVVFTDNSTNFPTSRTWTFQGGAPSTSSLFSPSVIYNAPGVYPVKLVVSNAIGTDSITQTNYITVNPAPNVILDSNTIAKCKFDDTVTVIATGGINYTWQPPFGISSPSNGVFKFFGQNAATYGIKGYDANGCYTQQILTLTLKAPPSTISIASIAGGFKVVTTNPIATSTFQWFVNGNPIANSNNDTLLTTAAGAYACKITIANGCTRTASPINFSALNAVAKTQLIFEIMPNPNSGKFMINAEAKDRISQLQITDVLGRKIIEFKVAANQLNKTFSIENSGIYFISLLNGNGKNIGTKKLIVE
jgi:PKD repeat protein/photosystem II stability/assembly factor-like uncharacterized protein